MTERIAVVVCHGMGQQVPFDTLSSVATSVGGQLGLKPDDIRTRLVASGDRYLARAELAADGKEVHVYESYWAPLVEGRVTLRDTLRFLVDAGSTGVRFALVYGEFDRWMFHTQQRFEIPARRVYQFAIALWVIVLLCGAYLTYGAAVVALLVHLFGVAQPNALHTADFISACLALLRTALVSAFTGAVIAMVWVYVLTLTRGSSRVKVTVNALTRVKSNVLLRLLSAAFALLFVLHEIGVTWNERFPESLRWTYEGEPHRRSGFLLLVLGGLLYGVARFLVEYVGDVAAYVSPYKVSKFQQIRSDIQSVGRTVTQHVYSATDDNGVPLYDAVCFVGHSLGSVVAYDSLNEALARDARLGGWRPGSPVGALDVMRRTRLLLTFGSPLDKTAFVFRTHGADHPVLREKVAAQVQPLIFDRDYRSAIRWLNLWSPFDWISGSLEYYDEGERVSGAQTAAGTDVRNIRVSASPLPWSAHSGYWVQSMMPAVLVRAIFGKVVLEGDAERQSLEQVFT